MKRLLVLLLLTSFLYGCGARKRARTEEGRTSENNPTVVVDEPVKETDEKPTKPKPVTSTTEYINAYKDIAVAEMHRYGIPASITLAQGILESGSGRGRLAVEANNHFGIKCHGWNGKKIYHDDDRRQECFRKYKDAWQSFRDHSEFLAYRKRYAGLFKLRKNDYKGWAKELRRSGYATDKRYPEKLISLIERYELYQYDTATASVNTDSPFQQWEYTVVKGDTLYSIARRYKLTVEQLKRLNGLNSDEISVGQILIIEQR